VDVASKGAFTDLIRLYIALIQWERLELTKSPGLWSPTEATKRINEAAEHDDFELWQPVALGLTMADRGLITGDLIHLLKTGFVYEEPIASTRDGYFKYTVEGTTPNSNGKSLKAVVIHDGCRNMKVVELVGGSTRREDLG
jgi:hypothetical protein